MTSPKDERSELVERYISGRGGHDSGCAFYRQGYGCNCRVAYWRDAFAAGLDTSLEPQAGMVSEDEEEAYERGLRDGYQKAVQDIDMLTGGERLTPSEQGSVVRLREALEPFANLDDVNMNDPLSKWLTVAQIKNAVDALSIGGEGSKNGPGQSDHEGGV